MGATQCQLREPSTPVGATYNITAQIPTPEPFMMRSVMEGSSESVEALPSPMQQGSLLCEAAARGDAVRLKALLVAKASPQATDYDRRTPLHLAAAEGYLQAVDMLLAAGADAKAKDRWGHTPLDEAVYGDFGEVQVALRLAGGEEGSTPKLNMDDLSPREDSGEPVAARLLTEVAEGNLEAVKRLCTGADIANSADYDGRTALHIATAYGHSDLVLWLLDFKADINAVDQFGRNALMEAEQHSHPDIAHLLRKRGAERDLQRSLLADSERESWALNPDEVVIEGVLSKTIKSVLYTATWHGTKVVVKTMGMKSESANCLHLMAPQTWAESELQSTDTETFKSVEREMLHEISLLSRMRHPDLVMFLGACLDHSPPFLVTEYMEGGDLERHFMRESAKSGHAYRPSWVTFIKWATSVARALAFLHGGSQRIIHRDLKPLNLLLNGSQELKVTDFGISKLMPKRVSTTGEKQYMSGGVGTWRYMAPEVVRCEEYTDRVDIYSYALILWFMATGQQPFEAEYGKDAELVLKEYLKGNEPRPSLTSSAAKALRKTPDLRCLVQACWAVQAAERPSANECTKQLSQIRNKYSSRSGVLSYAWNTPF